MPNQKNVVLCKRIWRLGQPCPEHRPNPYSIFTRMHAVTGASMPKVTACMSSTRVFRRGRVTNSVHPRSCCKSTLPPEHPCPKHTKACGDQSIYAPNIFWLTFENLCVHGEQSNQQAGTRPLSKPRHAITIWPGS